MGRFPMEEKMDLRQQVAGAFASFDGRRSFLVEHPLNEEILIPNKPPERVVREAILVLMDFFQNKVSALWKPSCDIPGSRSVRSVFCVGGGIGRLLVRAFSPDQKNKLDNLLRGFVPESQRPAFNLSGYETNCVVQTGYTEWPLALLKDAYGGEAPVCGFAMHLQNNPVVSVALPTWKLNLFIGLVPPSSHSTFWTASVFDLNPLNQKR